VVAFDMDILRALRSARAPLVCEVPAISSIGGQLMVNFCNCVLTRVVFTDAPQLKAC